MTQAIRTQAVRDAKAIAEMRAETNGQLDNIAERMAQYHAGLLTEAETVAALRAI